MLRVLQSRCPPRNPHREPKTGDSVTCSAVSGAPGNDVRCYPRCYPYAGDVDDVLPKCENGDLVIVNVFPDEETSGGWARGV